MLGLFKYYNFFIDSFVDAFTFLGSSLEVSRLNIILPVGISFYTFQTLSYTLDIYKGRLKPTNDFIAFLGFVSFFPQLVAGPIERARNLLPQFHTAREFKSAQATDGMRQMLWGLFKKVVIADNCALYVQYVYDTGIDHSASTLLAGLFVFAIQIYCDFSGYSDIAIGSARLFGFRLSKDFAFPFFSKSIPEFWRKWHISLTNWFRDYVFIPMTINHPNKKSAWIKYRNTIFLFVLIGFWHGASWTFVLFGLMHGLLYFRSFYVRRFSFAEYFGISKYQKFISAVRIIQTSIIWVLASVFFRVHDINHGIDYLHNVFSMSIFTFPSKLSLSLISMITIFMFIEWFQREKEHALVINNEKVSFLLRHSIYTLIIFAIFMLKAPTIDFIYFQF
jgi:D-alanyl-lipoteichoic acid acyltransferase DltB (MBOAT superfamily)